MNEAAEHGRGRIDPSRTVVLVVEDEVLIRMSAADSLVEAGYTVIEAATADEALDALEAGLGVDIVFTDIQMPGALDGLDLMEIVRQRFPSVSVIVTSGHEVPPPEALGDRVCFLPKPYAPDIVLGLVGRQRARQRAGHEPIERRAPAAAGDPAD